MAKGRKTLEVQSILDYANIQLARTDEFADMKFKDGIAVMLHHVLHRSGNYNGFRFLDSEDSELGTLGYASRYYY